MAHPAAVELRTGRPTTISRAGKEGTSPLRTWAEMFPTGAPGRRAAGPTPRPCSGLRSSGSHRTEILRALEFWPTPRAMDGEKGTRRATESTARRVALRQANLPEAVQEAERPERRMYPTPVTYDADPGGPGNHYKGLGWQARHLWMTPTRSDFTRRRARESWEGNDLVSQATSVEEAEGRPQKPAGGALNPPWVEWLMGFPIGWTGLKPSETPSSRKSRTGSRAASSKKKRR